MYYEDKAGGYGKWGWGRLLRARYWGNSHFILRFYKDQRKNLMSKLESLSFLNQNHLTGSPLNQPSPKMSDCSDTGKDSDISENSVKYASQAHRPELQQGSDCPFDHVKIEEKERERNCWGVEEEKMLLDLHDALGNKWTDIALRLTNRDHNSVKNHFYAQIRKSIRRINIFVSRCLRQEFKSLNISHISKMITNLSEKGSPLSHVADLLSLRGQQVIEIKHTMFYFAKKQDCDELSESQIEQLRRFMTLANFLLSEVKKSAPVGKKPKGRPSKKMTEAMQPPALISRFSEQKIYEGGSSVKEQKTQKTISEQISVPFCRETEIPSYFLHYCNQMLNSTAAQITLSHQIRATPLVGFTYHQRS